ncbi:MAG: hypothetical protein ACRYFS_24870 [Janthinobacterium lividum]
MAIKMPDYLAELKKTQISPVEILRKAAVDLGNQTQGLVEGSIFVLNPGGSTLFRYTFYLLVPSLNDYTDPLFYAWHDVNLYPVNVMMAGGKQGKDETKCLSPYDFENELQRIFDSEATRNRLGAMLELAQK